MGKPDEFIGVAEVAAELRLSPRQAWCLVRRLGVPCLGPTRDVLKMARFRRADWEAARDRSLAAPTPHGATPAPEAPARARKAPRPAAGGDKLGAWRRASK